MENPFKKILQDEKLPDYLKDRVIDNLNFIKLSLDVSELYTVQVPKVVESFIGDVDKEKEKKIIEKIKKEDHDGEII
ncbi:hypothetical protein [Myroides odoratus]|jgi:hypothetical protein|uniref:Uncharacterized protein n=1 Tax=Myroides odoratus TaxID=256 RepID=A0A9Q6Z5S3_MYROD|nr:hypothetical protein [Myroides odoratus]EHQ42755.1 hypothetical protein Myrod_1923 [Myroides odoratus DSM 2801]EKB07570.1 hypothetical protein HMPREF9716_01781 [Myroides odoratus CIP 103059]MDR0223689.1 hypothetical protein [Myroides odoratus]QQU00112.1 hypothetical protein I6I88_18440 [Myroides odoratus]WQD57667.1 hypothetical protein U0010_00510 [Myroides odoratus]